MRTALSNIAAFALVASFASCRESAPTPPPAPAAKPTVPADAPAPEPAAPAVPVGPVTVLHTIGEGQTLWDIARVYGMSLKRLMEANGFGPSDVRRLRAGVQLKVEPGSEGAYGAQAKALPKIEDGAYHMLQPGESLWTLARTYDVPIETLMTRNGFSEDVYGRLRPGQAVIIPGVAPSQIKSAEPQTASKGLTHKVASNESVWDIAQRYHVSVGEIMSANGLSAEQVQNLRDGQELFLPGIRKDRSGQVRRDSTATEKSARAVARRLGLGSLKAAGQLLHGRVQSKWIAAAGGGRGLAGTLRWPVAQGWFVRGFGSGQGGYHKAMDIMGKIGWNVRAAADGIVGYAGNQVPGFGNMVMVVHPGGWVTLYAHNSVNFVTAGQRVQKGSVLAEVGSTGRSTGPHVHFELIYDGKNCDPAPLFRPGVRHRSGKYSSIPATSWRDPRKRPRQIQCHKRQKHPIGAAVVNENPVVDQQPVDDRAARELPAEESL